MSPLRSYVTRRVFSKLHLFDPVSGFGSTAAQSRMPVRYNFGMSNFPNFDVSILSEDPSTGDGNAVTISASSGSLTWTVFGFGHLRTRLVGRQRFRARVRCTVSGGKVTAELWQGGAPLKSLGTKNLSAANTYEVLTWDWDAGDVTDPSRVQIRLVFDTSLSSGNYNIDSVDWQLNVDAQQQGGGGGSGGGSGSFPQSARLPVNSLLSTNYWSNFDYTKLTNNPDSPDNQVVTLDASLPNNFAAARLGFADPQIPVSGQQRFRVRVRCTVSGGSFRGYLYEAGALKREMQTYNVTSDFQIYTFDWDASEISNPNNVEIKLIFFKNSGGGVYELDAVDWLVNFSRGGTPAWPPGWGPIPVLGSHHGIGQALDFPGASYRPLNMYNTWLGRPANIAKVFALNGGPNMDSWDDVAGGPGNSDSLFEGQFIDPFPRAAFNNAVWPVNLPIVLACFAVPQHPNWANIWNGQWRSTSIWSEIRNGTYDTYIRRMWRRLAWQCGNCGRDPRTLVIRFCHEMNGDWFAWSVGPDKQSFIDGWRRCIDMMRQEVGNVLGQGKSFMIEFGPATHLRFGSGSSERLWNIYPGDDWVDICGLGIHDSVGYTHQAQWDARLTKSSTDEGYRDWYDFAVSRGKWVGTSEICSNVSSYRWWPRTENMHVMWTNGFEPLRRRYDGKFLYFIYLWIGGDRNRSDAPASQLVQPDGWGEPYRQLYKPGGAGEVFR